MARAFTTIFIDKHRHLIQPFRLRKTARAMGKFPKRIREEMHLLLQEGNVSNDQRNFGLFFRLNYK
jgi:hypothetical protein